MEHEDTLLCIHGLKTYSCVYCNENEDFDSEADNGKGLPKWFVTHDRMPANQKGVDLNG